MERDRFPTEAERIANARKAIENGKQAKFEAVVFDLSTHYRDLSKGRPPRGQNGKR